MTRFVAFLLFFICCEIQLKAQDFKIENFRENMTDLSLALKGVKDLNNRDAALLRFSVRDDKFEFEPNLGLLKQEVVTGEVRLFIPEGTKRITIRHPHLGVLRDYPLPVVVKSRTTYDADIVITNLDYLQVLFVKEHEQKSTVGVTKQKEKPSDGVVLVDHYADNKRQNTGDDQKKERNDDVNFLNEIKVYAGIGFNAISTMGPSVHLGASYSNFHLEVGYVLGLDKVEKISFAIKSISLSETYDYSCSKLWVRAGYSIGEEKFWTTPQVGVSFNMISGVVPSGVTNTTDYFMDSNPISAFAAVRFSYKVADNFSIYLTPQYDFTIGGDEIFEVIKQGDSKIKSWAEGFGINAGVILGF